jgi:hypothetical protein
MTLILTLLFLWGSNPGEAKERIRFDCSLFQDQREKPLEEFVLRLNESTQQLVTPERKFFIDLKESQIKTYENTVEKSAPALKLTLWVYDDFTAKYESQEHLMAKASQDFIENSKFMKVEAVHQHDQKVEAYRLECTRLERVIIPKHLAPQKKKKKPQPA